MTGLGGVITINDVARGVSPAFLYPPFCGIIIDTRVNQNEHLKNIFESGELEEKSVIRNFRITARDGKEYASQRSST